MKYQKIFFEMSFMPWASQRVYTGVYIFFNRFDKNSHPPFENLPQISLKCYYLKEEKTSLRKGIKNIYTPEIL